MNPQACNLEEAPRPVFVIALICAAVGLSVRFNGLGHWPLSVDEYYLTKSVLSLFDDGLPNFQCGGFYTRGLLQQYVSALSVAGLGNVEFAMRLFPMFCNIGAIWVAYRLGWRIGGSVVGYTVLALMSLSLWEIEMARFARMYAPFQFLAVLQVLLLTKVVLDKSLSSFKWMILVVVLGICTHEAAIFLAAPVLIALVRETSLRSPTNLFLAACSVVLPLVFLAVPFSELGVAQPSLPPDVLAAVSATQSGFLKMPDLGHLEMLIDRPVWLTGVALVFVALGTWAWKQSGGLPPIAVVGILVSLACIGMSLIAFGLVIYVCVVLVLLGDEDRNRALRLGATLIAPAAFIAGTVWMIFQALNGAVPLGDLLRTFLKFPNFLDPLLYIYWDAVPWLLVIMAVPVVIYVTLMLAGRARLDDSFALLAGVTLVFLTGVALSDTAYHATRYSFFVYPFLLCLFSCSLVKLSGLVTTPRWVSTAAPITAIALLSATEDFDLHHYVNIDTAEVNYRVAYPPALREHFKTRNDYRTTAEFVNRNASVADTIIFAHSALEYYLDRVDYRFKDIAGLDFRIHVKCGLEAEVWSNAPLLFREEQIGDLIRRAKGDIWVVKRRDRWGLEQWSQFEVFRGEDGEMQVLRIPAGSLSGSGDGG